MYGTVARLRPKPGRAEELLGAEIGGSVDGFVAAYGFQADDEPDEVWLVGVFEDKEKYLANANSPEQHERYLRMRELLTEDPEWHDGRVLVSRTKN